MVCHRKIVDKNWKLFLKLKKKANLKLEMAISKKCFFVNHVQFS